MEILTLEELNNGGVISEVNEAVKAVANNMVDPKTEMFKPRKVVMTLTFQRDKLIDSRINVDSTVETKLMPRVEDCGSYEIEADFSGNPVIGKQLELDYDESA